MNRRFSTYHITSAAHNGRIAGEAEEAKCAKGIDGIHKNESIRRWQPIHDSHVVSSIIAAYAGVEASINEFISRPAGPHQQEIRHFNRNYPGDLIREKPTLKKAQLVLRLSGVDVFANGEELYQDVNLIRMFRNHFVHHKQQSASNSLIGGLSTKGVGNNPFAGDSIGELDQYLSYSASKWAFESSLDFINEFHHRVETSSPFEAYEERLRNEIQTDWVGREPQW
ncbi:hypothetical protein [Haloferax sp. YSSS75]|uniref:hypothetical protein n=1 Tax=Haloferax sp. YSSS75 TaxID=3388564 RepID=UPI00398D1B80